MVPDTVDIDRARQAEIEALMNGEAPPPPESESARIRRALLLASSQDPDARRSFLEVMAIVAPPSVALRRSGLVERVTSLAAGQQLRPLPAPTRQQLLDLVA